MYSMDIAEIKKNIINAGRCAVNELIKVAKEPIVTNDMENDLSADKLKNAAQAKRIAIMDAFDILKKIEEEENILNGVDAPLKAASNKGFAEKHSK
jgi:hypothetical protein